MSSVGSRDDSLPAVDLMRYVVCDINGVGRSHVCPGGAPLESHTAAGGLSTWVSILALGVNSEIPPPAIVSLRSHGNGLLRPRWETLRHAHWAPVTRRHPGTRVEQVLCEMAWADGTPQEACPRYVARRVLSRLEDELGGITLKSGFESEFCIYDQGSKAPAFDGTKIVSHAETCRREELFYQVCQALPDLCSYLKVEYFPGQLEVPLMPRLDIASADDMFTLKMVLREIINDRSRDSNSEHTVTFMTCPSPGVNCGAHFNHSLWDSRPPPGGGRNVLYDSNREHSRPGTPILLQ